ncbi:envelope stress response membrane protein PspB [Sphingomonas quercus]|uniref:Envelope stress response membrane protein PspB n=1 Tax=Sphingomonas quercus TaxID=2842451 RepID=A0ABS6BJA2_9SPHN|nr:envelope stress response membrane protein PspB [Sphingomonas quercus]MBU3078380.1 envelope stress response membrane protein PspB [Sphingomonas quercus]
MEDVVVPIAICGFLFIGLPWLIFHYVTQWKKGGALTIEDERLLDEMHDLARRLSERLDTIERIVAADNPGFRPGAARPEESFTAALANERRIQREDELLSDRDTRDKDAGARFRQR